MYQFFLSFVQWREGDEISNVTRPVKSGPYPLLTFSLFSVLTDWLSPPLLQAGRVLTAGRAELPTNQHTNS